jgi:hypothetical protein
MNKRKELEELKDYCKNYVNIKYGKENNYIRKTRITKKGLFIYGHKVYAPEYNEVYDIYTFINWYSSNDLVHVVSLLDHFVLDCKRLKEEE